MADIKKLKKSIVNVDADIQMAIKEKIESLTDDEIKALLKVKWINPVIDEINATVGQFINATTKGLEEIQKKYANPLSELNIQLQHANEELFTLIGDLVGSDIDMKALQLLKEVL